MSLSPNEGTIASAEVGCLKRANDDMYVAGASKPSRGSKKTRTEQETPPRAAPYFFYTDHSREADDDPLTPVTPPNSVPSFPIKLHAILSMPEYSDILAWDTHGRSFRILKPKRFERDIVPKYFEHTKLSSFTRQVNGWGFRRLMEGANMGSYYEENFLRSMPWLVKNMKRPKVGEKKSFSQNYEPDLAAISEEFPVPNHPMTREIQVVLETIQKGAKAKMPEHYFLDGEELGLTAFSGNINVDNNLKPAAQPEQHSLSTVAANATTAAAYQPVPFQDVRQNTGCRTSFPSDNGAALLKLLQSVQHNTNNQSLAALPNVPPSGAALLPPAPAPSSDLLNYLLLRALQQNGRTGPMAAVSHMQDQNQNAGTNNLLNSVVQFMSQKDHNPSLTGTQNLSQVTLGGTSHVALTPSPPMITAQNIVQSLLQQNQANSISTAYPNHLTPSSVQYSNADAHNLLRVIPTLTSSQLQGMSTEQLQYLLKSINKP